MEQKEWEEDQRRPADGLQAVRHPPLPQSKLLLALELVPRRQLSRHHAHLQVLQARVAFAVASASAAAPTGGAPRHSVVGELAEGDGDAREAAKRENVQRSKRLEQQVRRKAAGRQRRAFWGDQHETTAHRGCRRGVEVSRHIVKRRPGAFGRRVWVSRHSRVV